MASVAGLAALTIVLFGPAGVWLDRARWLNRAPRAAIALWQATGLAGALAAIGTGLALAVAPLHLSLVPGVIDLVGGAVIGHPLGRLGVDQALGLTLASDVSAVLLAGLVLTTVRTVAARRRHRVLLDLVSTRSDDAPDAVLLDDPRAAAYCLPGLRPRIVLSAGALRLLDPGELRAVISHEHAHAHGHHDLALLPFASMVALLDWTPYVRRAPRAVAGLLEMAADDSAARRHQPRVLASALIHMVGSHPSPPCAFAAASGAVAERVRRLVEPNRTSRLVAVVAGAVALVVVAVPVAALAVL
jgi:Zn-dependent protease with chaperone function